MNAAFHRTPNGLSNQALFSNADYVLFVEGGAECSLADLGTGVGDPCTLDAAFWSSILQFLPGALRVDVRSVGSKNTVRSVAYLVSDNEVANVMVAMDRDFDDRRGRLLQCGKVFYTYGYSWESDVFTADVVREAVRSLAPPPRAMPQIDRTVQEASQEIERGFSILVRVDHSLAVAGAELTSREIIRKSIRLDDKVRPTIDRAAIAAELRRQRTLGICRINSQATASVDRDLDGHTKARWWAHTLRHLLRVHLKQKPTDDLMKRIAIAAYLRTTDSESLKHYREIMAAVSS